MPSARSRPRPAALGASAAAQHTQHIEPTHLHPGSSSNGLAYLYDSVSVYHVHLFRVVLSGGSITALRPRFRCDDSVTSSNFNRRNLPILTSGATVQLCTIISVMSKLTFLDDGRRNSDFLHSQSAARALFSSSRPGQSGDACRDGLCELCSPRKGDVGCDPVNTLEHSGLL